MITGIWHTETLESASYQAHTGINLTSDQTDIQTIQLAILYKLAILAILLGLTGGVDDEGSTAYSLRVDRLEVSSAQISRKYEGDLVLLHTNWLVVDENHG